jgi:hypothetical protein
LLRRYTVGISKKDEADRALVEALKLGSVVCRDQFRGFSGSTQALFYSRLWEKGWWPVTNLSENTIVIAKRRVPGDT